MNETIISTPPPDVPLTPPEEKKKSNTWLIVVIVLLVLCCCCLCLGVVATWVFRFSVHFISSLFGWVAPSAAHLASILTPA